MATFSSAYREAGYELNNPRNQWSAQRADGKVAITVWKDEIDRSEEPWLYDLSVSHRRFDYWKNLAGNTVRRRHIASALERGCNEFDLILCEAEDPYVEPRKVRIARHWKQRKGRIVEGSFDSAVGTFVMELVPAGA